MPRPVRTARRLKRLPKGITLYQGDCLDALRELPDNSINSVVTDPPYGISFMGSKWDYAIPTVEVWAECLRVMKPGGFILSFASTRTYHRMAVNIEDAGFELRDTIAWVYGSGFPKSLNVSKAIDKAAGAEVSGDGYIPNGKNNTHGKNWGGGRKTTTTAPDTPEAKQWDGWGTALKPAMELITVARKPFKGTVAANVLEHGCGAINVDATRIKTEDSLGGGMVSMGRPKVAKGWDRPWMHDTEITDKKKVESAASVAKAETLGRFPANLIHDGSEEVVELFPVTKSADKRKAKKGSGELGENFMDDNWEPKQAIETPAYSDKGSAARFFYCAKANKKDRNSGLNVEKNSHPTVKPTDLMRYLCRLVTPVGGIVFDPYMGSGSTGKAAVLEGFAFVGAEKEEDYCKIAKKRIVREYLVKKGL